MLILTETGQEKKANSVKRRSQQPNAYRIDTGSLMAILSPSKNRRVASLTRLNTIVETLFKAKMPTGEELSFTGSSVVKPLRRDETSEEFLAKDSRGRYFRKKIIKIDALERIYGIDFWKVKSVFKIYMTMSPFLPEIYKIDWNELTNELDIYLTYFEYPGLI
jgi:hypothetical protein